MGWARSHHGVGSWLRGGGEAALNADKPRGPRAATAPNPMFIHGVGARYPRLPHGVTHGGSRPEPPGKPVQLGGQARDLSVYHGNPAVVTRISLATPNPRVVGVREPGEIPTPAWSPWGSRVQPHGGGP